MPPSPPPPASAHASAPADTDADGDTDADRVQRLQTTLLAWYAGHGRALSWRGGRDPYRILVSEIMLQQTQAARVEPIFAAFCQRFPSVGSLAGAPVGDVLVAWGGLGYNRRAVNLHRAAGVIVTRHGGRVPEDLDDLRALPGVGEYTARAVRTFAFGHDDAPVDTNVGRVLARAVTGAALTPAAAQRLATASVPPGRAAQWSQALMDLGAGHCGRRAPRCASCPISAECAWRRAGARAGNDPADSTAGRSRPQGPFAGSDRYHRGRLVEALRRGPVAAEELAAAAGLEDAERLDALARRLVGEGLAEWHGGHLRLPGAGGPARA